MVGNFMNPGQSWECAPRRSGTRRFPMTHRLRRSSHRTQVGGKTGVQAQLANSFALAVTVAYYPLGETSSDWAANATRAALFLRGP
jgi:hypothetical protein